MLVHRRSLPSNLLGFPNNLLVPIYTSGWQEALWKLHLPVSYWASNRMETFTALDDERETTVRDIFAFTWVNLISFFCLLTWNLLLLGGIFVFFSSLQAQCLNTCCQHVVTTSAFPQLQLVTKLNHAWWGVQLSTNLGWLAFDFAAIYRGLLHNYIYTTKYFTSVKLNWGKHHSWKHGHSVAGQGSNSDRLFRGQAQ